MPVGVASLVSAGSAVAGSVIGSNAASAGQAELQAAAQQGNSILSGVQNQSTSNLQPYAQQGQQYNSALAGLLGVGGNPTASSAAFKNYLNSTNYQFQLGQGENAVEYANAPAFSSGATAKALNNYAQGQAGSALQGYEGLLQTGAGQGIQAGASLASANTQNAASQASNLLGAASGEANLGVYGASSITNALKGFDSGISSFGSSGGGNALAGLFGGGGGGGGGAAGGATVNPGNNSWNMG